MLDVLKKESMEDLKGGGSPLSQEISPVPPHLLSLMRGKTTV